MAIQCGGVCACSGGSVNGAFAVVHPRATTFQHIDDCGNQCDHRLTYRCLRSFVVRGKKGMLLTVKVPAGFEGLFTSAEKVVSNYFEQRKLDPEHGSIEVSGERYVLVRAASLSVEFFAFARELYGSGREAEADEFARNILFDLSHAIGR